MHNGKYFEIDIFPFWIDKAYVEIELTDEKFFFTFIKAAFAQRRKTLVNTVSSSIGVSKDLLREALNAAGLPETARGESLTMSELASVANYLAERK